MPEGCKASQQRADDLHTRREESFIILTRLRFGRRCDVSQHPIQHIHEARVCRKHSIHTAICSKTATLVRGYHILSKQTTSKVPYPVLAGSASKYDSTDGSGCQRQNSQTSEEKKKKNCDEGCYTWHGRMVSPKILTTHSAPSRRSQTHKIASTTAASSCSCAVTNCRTYQRAQLTNL